MNTQLVLGITAQNWETTHLRLQLKKNGNGITLEDSQKGPRIGKRRWKLRYNKGVIAPQQRKKTE